MAFTFTSPAPEKEDRCTSVLEAQRTHARGINDCTSRAIRTNPYNGRFFACQADHFLNEDYARRVRR
jgi:hypothetical protein